MVLCLLLAVVGNAALHIACSCLSMLLCSFEAVLQFNVLVMSAAGMQLTPLLLLLLLLQDWPERRGC
jgi:hypothetical protein